MKTPSQRLFKLIKQLTPAEQRYVSVALGKNASADAKYVQLFQLINEQNVFDDLAIIENIYGEKPKMEQKLSELKNYLYLTLLNILQEFDKESTLEHRLQRMLANIPVLYKRALYDDCLVLMSKMEKSMEESELFEVSLELLRWEKKIAYAKGDITFFSNHLPRITTAEKKYYEQAENLHFYKISFYKVYALIRKQGLLGRAAMIDELLGVMSNELFLSEKKALSKRAKILFYRIQSMYSYAIFDYEKFYEQGQVLLYLIEGYPVYLQEEIAEYISVLSNFVMSCFATNRYETVAFSLEKLAKITPRTYDDSLKIHRQYYQGKFQLCVATGDFEVGYKALQIHFKEKKQFDNQEFTNSGFYFAYFYIAFGCGKFEEAHGFLTDWLSISRSADRQDLQLMARLLNLVLHFEMGNTLLLDSLLRSTSRYITRRTKLAAFERLLMRFLREAYHTPSKQALTKLMNDISKEFEILGKDNEQNIFTQYFDFIAWIESKVTGKTFAETVQLRMKTANL